jgi:hypothetical protein
MKARSISALSLELQLDAGSSETPDSILLLIS